MKNGCESLEARNRARLERRLELGHGAKCCECGATLAADSPMYALGKDSILCADCAESRYLSGSGCRWCGTKILVNYAPNNLCSCTRYCMIRHSKNKAKASTRCMHCAESFTPKRSTAAYCSTKCRVASKRGNGDRWSVNTEADYGSFTYGPFTSRAGADDLAAREVTEHALWAAKREREVAPPTVTVELYTPPPPALPAPVKTRAERIAEGMALASRSR